MGFDAEASQRLTAAWGAAAESKADQCPPLPRSSPRTGSAASKHRKEIECSSCFSSGSTRYWASRTSCHVGAAPARGNAGLNPWAMK